MALGPINWREKQTAAENRLSAAQLEALTLFCELVSWHVLRIFRSSVMASILDLASVISAHTSIEEQIAWFQSKGLLARTKSCPTCNHAMDMQSRSDISDKYRYIQHYITKQLSVYRWYIKKYLFHQGGGVQC